MNSTAPPIKVFLAEDSDAVRQRIHSLLAGTTTTVVGEASSATDCIDGILASGPDVVILDVRLQEGTGLDVLKTIHAALPKVNFIVFSNSSSPAYRSRYLQAGACRFLDKSTEFDHLAEAVMLAGAAGRRGGLSLPRFV